MSNGVLSHDLTASSRTVDVYRSPLWTYGFDKDDGHLAFIYDRRLKRFTYKCECIELGEEITGLKL